MVNGAGDSALLSVGHEGGNEAAAAAASASADAEENDAVRWVCAELAFLPLDAVASPLSSLERGEEDAKLREGVGVAVSGGGDGKIGRIGGDATTLSPDR